ncbi:MAG: PAS domain S-box protein [Desulfobacula sp.]|nr:PAS domain S-box protein [Desulfobacula sp.]
MGYKLQDLIDIDHFQNLQDRLNKIYSFPSSIIDNDGNILTATAWQEICMQFHRKNKEAERICIKSDQYIKDHIHEANPALSYRCPHGLVDNATPIIIDGVHYGNFFTGQFFLEAPDLSFFSAQAKKYGFDENAYLAAVKKVPIWSQKQLENYLFFIKGLIEIIAESGLKNLREIENRKQIQKNEQRNRTILKTAMDGFWVVDTDGRLLEVNDTYCRMSGYSEGELLAMHIWDLEIFETRDIVTGHIRKLISAGSDRFQSRHRRKNGSVFDVEISVQFRPEQGGQCICFLRDISDQKQIDTERENMIQVLEILNAKTDIRELMRSLLNFIQEISGCESVGVRLREGNDFPYYETRGFSDDFIETETHLCVEDIHGQLEQDDIGNPVLECMCGNIIRGRTDPSKPFFTQFGSFVTNSTTRLLADTSEADRQARTRNRCNGEGYESVLLIPLRAGSETFGLLQLNDRRENRFSSQVIAHLERIAGNVALVLAKHESEEALRQHRDLLNATQQIAHIGGWEWDIKGQTMTWTDETYRIHGMKPGEPSSGCPELIDRSLACYDPDDRPVIRAAFRRCTTEGLSYDLDFILTKVDGRRIWVRTMAHAVKERDHIVKVVGNIIDITERKQAEKSLRDSEKKYRTLFENMAQGVFYQRADGVLFDYNNAALEMFGLTSDQFIGKTSYDQQWKVINTNGTELPGDKHPSMVALQTGKPVHDHIVGVYNPRRKDYNWLLVNAIPQFGIPGEKPDQVFVTLQDITDRRQLELQYQMLFQEMLDGFALHEIICDATGQPVDYRFLAVNPAFEKMTGLRAEQVEGRTAFEILPGLERHWIDTYGKVALTGEPAFFENYAADLKKHFRVTSFRPLPNQFACIFQDITERKLAEAKLNTAHEKMLTILDSIDSTVYVADMATHEILFMNKKMITEFGGDKTGEKCFRAFRNQSEPCGFCNNAGLVDAAGRPAGVLTWHDQNLITGKYYINHDRAIEWTDGRLVRLQIATDITDIKNMEARLALAQKMESIGTLAGGIAHDFNNILFPLIGHTEMLLEDIPEDGPIRDSLNQIYSSSLRARDLVKQILAFARQEKNELKLMKMQPIVKETMKLIRSTIPATINITQNLQPDCGPVSADPTQIHQIVMNLATNAYHAMEENGGELKVSLREIELSGKDSINPDMSPGLYACLSIADTGLGMNKDVMNRIFDPFFTTKKKGKGTGMGLSVVHGIVKQINGDIQVYSEPGKGTAFHIFLPIVKSADEKQATPTHLPILGGMESVLLVDDEDSILKMERQVLERLGYQVTSRTGSIEALEAFRSNPDKFDLVITDMTMPKMTGDKLAAELIRICPGIPVLLCTGYSENMTHEKIKSLGIKGLLKKPIVIKDLAEKIREVLDKTSGGPRP